MVGRVHRRLDDAFGLTVRTVLVVLPPLVLHDVTLVVELRLRHRGQKETHAIGLEPQRELELIRGQDLEVVRAIRGRRTVERSAGFLQELEVLLVADVLGALEEHVLEQVREARATAHFASAADVVVDVHGHDRIGVVFVHDQLEPVLEHELL
jgi:hypothetical protein